MTCLADSSTSRPSDSGGRRLDTWSHSHIKETGLSSWVVVISSPVDLRRVLEVSGRPEQLLAIKKESVRDDVLD